MKFIITTLVATAVSLLSGAASAEQVRLIHAINGTDLGLNEALPVDIRVGRRCVARGVPYRTIATDLNLHPAIYVVRVSLANDKKPCRGTRVLTDFLNVNFGENLTLVAHETDDGTIRLSRFVNDVRSAGDVNGRVTVRHTADAPAVDILVNGSVAIPNLSNPESAKADLPEDTYAVEIAPAGGSPIVGPVNLPIPQGIHTVVYAIGSLGTGSFELLVDSIPLN